jgi:hypothetical protein
MSQFEFFMTFYGLLLGLGVAELMLGFANLLRTKVRPKLGLLTPLLGATIFLQAMATFMDAWLKLQDIALNFRGLAIPTLIGICFFVLGIIVVPRDLQEWDSLDDYFRATRKWSLGLLLAVNLLIIGYEFPLIQKLAVAGKEWNVAWYVFINAGLLAMLATALFARPRWVIATALTGISLFFVYFYSGLPTPIFSG